MKRTLIALMMALVMLVSLTACSAPAEEPADTSAPAEPADTSAPAEPAEPAAETYTVGICQLVPHVALDAATQGFMDALKEEFGDKVTFDNQNASNDIPMCSTIIKSSGRTPSCLPMRSISATPSTRWPISMPWAV